MSLGSTLETLRQMHHRKPRAPSTKPRPLLTPRQTQVAELLVLGLSNKEIAWRLGIAVDTEKIYVYEMYRRAGVGGRLAFAKWYAEHFPATEKSGGGGPPRMTAYE